jgi:hypothetical protein
MLCYQKITDQKYHQTNQTSQSCLRETKHYRTINEHSMGFESVIPGNPSIWRWGSLNHCIKNKYTNAKQTSWNGRQKLCFDSIWTVSYIRSDENFNHRTQQNIPYVHLISETLPISWTTGADEHLPPGEHVNRGIGKTTGSRCLNLVTRFEIHSSDGDLCLFAALTCNITMLAFWVATPCGLLGRNQCFGRR